jgi:hypothetical protein
MADSTSLPPTSVVTTPNNDEINFIPSSSLGTVPGARTSAAPSLLAGAAVTGPANDRSSTNQTQDSLVGNLTSKNTSLKESWNDWKRGLSDRFSKSPVEQVRAFKLPKGPLNFGGFRCWALNNKKFLRALSRALNEESGGFSRLITEGPDGGRVNHISASTREIVFH